jgi:cystathionine gamma-lyase
MMRDATRVVRAGLPAPSQGQPFLPGPVFAAPFHLAGGPASAAFSYGRYHNPTWGHFERALSELEGGQAIIFASGMAAAAAVFGCTLGPGDALVLPADGYYTARMLAEGYFASFGVEVRSAPTADNGQAQRLDGAKLLWLESPTNPGLDVCDIAHLAAEAHARGVLVAVDNTTATVLGQRPLDLGADFSLASDTKALTGHADIVLGHVAVRDAQWADRLRGWRTQFGAVPGPMEVWLAHRSLGTLELRLARMVANALGIARFLSGRPEVKRVRYPGLPADPAHETAVRQMQRFGPVVGFELASHTAAEKFLSACRLIIQATSFGGLHTTAERRARWGSDKVADSFIRLSAGCEHHDDLLEDLAQALSSLALLE